MLGLKPNDINARGPMGPLHQHGLNWFTYIDTREMYM